MGTSKRLTPSSHLCLFVPPQSLPRTSRNAHGTMRTVHYSSDPTHMPETALDHGEPAPQNTNLDILINAISANPTPAEPRPHGQLSIQSLLAASQQLASPPMPVDQQQQWATADPNRPQVSFPPPNPPMSRPEWFIF